MASKGEKKPDKGLSFPTDAKGERSTTVAGKNVIAAAIRGSGAPGADDLATQCEREKNWRFKYNKHYMNMVKVSAHSPQAAIGVAKAGIEYMHSNFEFVNPSNTSSVVKFSEYMKGQFKPFETATIIGNKVKDAKPQLSVPYKGKVLTGDSLKSQLTKWAKYGTMEPDAAASISKLANGPLDLTGQHFVLIGAGSAMGPFIKLLEHGATVVAIDIPGAWGAGPIKMWERLVTTARNSPGTLIFPIAKPQNSYLSEIDMFGQSGCNLTEQPGEIAAWLKTVAPKHRLTIGNYTYLDGDLHVKLSLAADAVISELCKTRNDTNIAFLCTPTDIHFVPDEAHAAAQKHFGFHIGKEIEMLINLLTMGTKLVKNAIPPVTAADGSKVKLIDGLSVAQGPNYALAKRLQHWRAVVAYEGNHTVSSNIAPSTSTLSVVSNKSFGWAYQGMPYFKPYEIFVQETTNALMAAVLIADVTDKAAVANPANRKASGIKNPLELFKFNSVHGGLWRAAYKVDSIGEVSAIIYFMGGPKKFLPVVYTILAVIAFLIAKFVLKLI
mmetsp:Transcript_85990/g.168199  ORF Transcript_85990/g.168199 Transcript_85990/m.168199 type:complete len:552 (+) Transcript_85990:84-1739(+)